MFDDRPRGFVEPNRLALDAITRVGNRALIGALGNAHTFDADREAREVHHDEHKLETAILLTDQIADGTALVAVGEHRRWTRMNAELVLERYAVHVVTLAERSIGVDQVLRHDE